jgi:hypothetical protein
MIDKTAISNVLRSPKTKKYGLRVLVMFLLIGGLGFFALPPLVKSLLVSQLGEVLHRPVSVERVSINPYNLSLKFDGVAVQEKGGGETVAGFDSLYVNLESASLLRGGPVLSEIRLAGPKVKLVRLAAQRYNFSDLIDEFLAKPESDATPPFSLNNIQISGGVLEFDDRLLDEKHVISDITLMLPFVSSLSYATEIFVEPAFSAKIDGATLAAQGKSKPFDVSHESELSINLDDLQLAKYHDYLPRRLPIQLVSGALDGDLKVHFRQDKDKPPTLTVSGSAALKGVVVKESSGAPLLALKRLDLLLGSADLLNRKFVIDRIALDSPEIHARVGAQGTINWQDVLTKAMADAKTSAPPVAKPAVAAPLEWSVGEAKVSGGVMRWLDESRGKAVQASVEGFDLDLKKLTSNGKTPAEFDVSWRVNAEEWLKVEALSVKGGRLNLAKHEVQLGEVVVRGTRMLIRRAADGSIESLKPPALRAVQTVQKDTSPAWKVTVVKYRGEDLGVRFEDKAVSPAATQVIKDLNVELENISTEPGQTTKLASRFKLNDKGEVNVGGSVKLVPLEAALKLDIKAVELLPLQPYFTEKLNVEVTRGQLTLGGDLQLRQGGAGGLAGGFNGAATIGDFSAIDKINAADFLRWKSLYFGKVDLHLNPDSVSINEIALSDFFARVIVSPEGKLNLLQIVRKETQAPVSVAPAAPAPDSATRAAPASGKGKAVAPVAVANKAPLPIKIGKVTLQGGTVNFSDNFVKPNYSARLRQIGGRVSGLSSASDSTANVELRGSYDNVAPLNVTGRINPFAAKPSLDLQAEVKGIEMSSFSPYSGKYAGYAIEKGKLSLFVKYKIENNQLEAENRVFLDQLTFGDPVASPDATKLPVTLAVALLKNRQGEIDINLPISGSLDDPQFSMGGLIVKVIVNLFVKAVTSPFALLGSVFGSGGGELSNVEFEYGYATIGKDAQLRLENLSKALLDRPALKLEIAGRVDLERDREGLKHAMLERKVRAQKRDELTKSNGENASSDVVEVGAKEYPVLLERVYRAEKFPKPRNLIGLVKSLPVEEMEKLILTNTTVDEDDLRALGDRRARVVRDWLIAREVPTERIFLLPAKLGSADAKTGASEKAKESRADFSLK